MKTVALGTFALLIAGSVAFAADKMSTPFIDTSSIAGGSNGFVNGTSAGVSKTGGCTIQVQLKKLQGVPDGEQVICTGSADVKAAALPGGAGNSVVWRAPVAGGNVKIKNSVAVIDVGGQHCGSATTISWNSTTTCYREDSGYDPAAACGGAGGLWVASPAGTVNLVGLCQGFTLGFRIPAPSSGKIAETGMTILTGAK